MNENNLLSASGAREIVVPPRERLRGRPPEQWVSAPELVHLLGLAQLAERICATVWTRSLSLRSGQATGLIYPDAAIFMTALVMRIWRLSLGEMTRWLRHYPALARACGYPAERTISKSHLSRRLRQLGPVPFLLYLIWAVRCLIAQGVITGRDLIIDSTTGVAWYHADLEAAYSWAKQFGYKVHTILCRHSCLPLWFIVTPAHRNDGVFAPSLLKAVVALYGCGVEVVRADAAYWTKALLALIVRLGARIAVDYNVRRKNKSLVPRAWILWWDKRMGKRATIERFFAIAKRWFGLNNFHGCGWAAFLMHTLLTYCAILSVALVAVRVGQPDLRLSPRRLLAPC